MPEFSVKAIHATIGGWEWRGYAADEPHRLREHRSVSAAEHAGWGWGQEIDEGSQGALWPVEAIAAAAIRGAWLAERPAETAAWKALHGRYRELEVASATSLCDTALPPRCTATLHEVRVSLEHAWHGETVSVAGSPRLPRVTSPRVLEDGAFVPPALLKAARYAHRLAFRSAAAAMRDAAVRLGSRVPTAEAVFVAQLEHAELVAD